MDKILKSIYEAEKKASLILKNTEKKAEKVVLKAKEDSKALFLEKTKEMEKKEQEELSKKQKQMLKKRQEIFRKTNEEIKILEKKAKTNAKKAVDYIVKGFMKKC